MKRRDCRLFYIPKRHDDYCSEHINPPGFTIVELLIVIVVIGILAAITIVAYTGISQRAIATSLISDVDNASKQLKLYYTDHGAYPTSIDANNCPLGSAPSPDTKYCVKSSANTTFTYMNTAIPQLFCISATNGSQSYNASQDNTPVAGPCPVIRLDASNTTSYSGTGTTWTDLSGNGNNGILNGSVTYSTGYGGALSFNGSSSYVSLPNDIVTTANIRANGITYSAWVKSVNTTTEQRIVGQKPSGGYSDLASGGLGISSNKAKMMAYDDNISYKYSVGNTALQNNIWYLITGTYDPSDKNIRIYVNGKQDGTPVAIITFNRLDINGENLIGALNTSSTYDFYGFISSVGIYNRVLSPDEVLQNFNAQRSHYGI